MKVLSLFDGVSCGRVALERAGVPVESYQASEVCDYSIRVALKNYPDTVELGDVRGVKAETLPDGIDLLIGGSPCQSFSFAGKMVGMATKDHVDIVTLNQYMDLKEKGFEFDGFSYLFWEYVRLLKEVKPRFFLLENVLMSEKWKRLISDTLGVEPVMLNSRLVSAQDRKRLYWTNIPIHGAPEDKHIYIEDILEKGIEHKWLPETRQDYTNYDKSKVDKSVFPNTAIQIGNSRKFGNSVRSDGKAFTLRRVNPNGIIAPDGRIRKFTPVEAERLQTLPDNYTLVDGISDYQRCEAMGNGWTADIIAWIFSFLPEASVEDWLL